LSSDPASSPALDLSSNCSGPVCRSLLLGGVGLGHFLLGWLGSQLGAGLFPISPIWPAAGFALAMIFTFGYRVVPALLPAELLVNLVGGASLVESLAITLAALAGPSLGAVLLGRFVNIGSPTADSRAMGRMLAILALAVPAATAVLGVGGLLAVGGLAPESLLQSLATWWVGDAVGNLIVAPFVFTWLTPRRRWKIQESPWEGGAALTLLSSAGALAFWQEAIWGMPVVEAQYLILPFLIWATLRFGLVGAASGNLVAAATAVSASLAGVGHYGGGTALDLAGLEGLLILTSATNLMLGVVVSRKEAAIDEARETARLQKSLRELNDMIDQPYIGMLLVDGDGVVQFANPAAGTLMNREPDDLLGTQMGLPLVADRKTEIEIRRGPEELGEAEITVHPIQWDGQTVYLLSMHDVTERNQAERAVRHQAYHDELTGLPNRVHFEEGVRGTDMVARMSGDEFTILLDDIPDREMALRVAEKLRDRLFPPVVLKGQTITPSGTLGLSLFPDDGDDVETLIMRADTAMYAAKEAGRNRIHAYAPQHGALTSRRFRLEQALRQAPANGELHLVYQPQMASTDHRLVGVEALLRWQSPEHGLVSPGDFVPLLEETGMIQDVGEWVFSQANADLHRWAETGIEVPRVWVNVSAHQLGAHQLIHRLDRLAKKEGLDPARFGIELTESGVAGNVEHSDEILGLLRERGFGLAMDDFGTGYSALYYLRRLPFDVVKIDKAFIQEIEQNAKDFQLIRAIITMAHGLEMVPVAEGVETEAQARLLQAEGCDSLQGFLLANPMAAEQIPAFCQGPTPEIQPRD